MTCPAILTVRAGGAIFGVTYKLPCSNAKPHGPSGHKIDIRKLMLEFEGAPGGWTARIVL